MQQLFVVVLHLMHPTHLSTDIACRSKTFFRSLVVGTAMCTAVTLAVSQDLKLSESIQRTPNEPVTQMLQDMGRDAQERNRSTPVENNQGTHAQQGIDTESETETVPTLSMLKGFYSAAQLKQKAKPLARKAALPPSPSPKSRSLVAMATAAPVSRTEKAEVSQLAASAPPAPMQATPTTPAVAPMAAQPKESMNVSRDGLPPLGVGDQITIAVFGQPDLAAEVTVGESGIIMVPLIGTLNVLNMSAAQLETMVASRLKDGGYLQNPGVSVQIRQLRSQLVSVIGEVQRPGRYPIQGRMTVLEALATAGGLNPRADKTIVLLRKPSAEHEKDSPREEISIQLETEAGQFRGRLDALLINDDVVFVGVQKQFYIHGEVRRPGVYPMESGLNIMKALSISGGVSERGSVKRIKIHRMNAEKVLQELPGELAMPIYADDVIYVNERLF